MTDCYFLLYTYYWYPSVLQATKASLSSQPSLHIVVQRPLSLACIYPMLAGLFAMRSMRRSETKNKHRCFKRCSFRVYSLFSHFPSKWIHNCFVNSLCTAFKKLFCVTIQQRWNQKLCFFLERPFSVSKFDGKYFLSLMWVE